MIRSLVLAVMALSFFSCQEPIENPVKHLDDLGLMPKPQEVELEKGAFTFDENTQLVFQEKGKDVASVDIKIQAYVTSQFENLKLGEAFETDKHALIFERIAKEELKNLDAYRLNIDADKIKIEASSEEGFFYGFQTLLQLFPNTIESDQSYILPALSINDWSTFSWRGAHLDVCRHFYSAEFVKKYIDQLSKHKMNVFHWHLTEDQGWRIEIKKYPKLTEIGSKRKETIVGKNFDPYIGDTTEYGGFYTQEQIKEIVAYAADRFVTVVPEIELPGHAMAAIASYPHLSCTGEQIEVATSWGVFDDVYCAGNDSVFAFLEDVMDEVIELFPSEYIHIGGDECPKTRWKTCEKCQSRMNSEGLKDEHELQSYFIKRMEQYLLTKNKSIIGWDEILEGGLAPNATVMSWRGEAGGIEAAKQNHAVIMTPGSPCYFDHYQSENKKVEPLAIGGYNSLKSVYLYDPLPKDLPADKQQYILGAQANVWTEYMPNAKHVEYMLFPRLCALSEVLWTANKEKDFDNFEKRLNRHYQRLDAWDINYRKHQKED